MKKSSQLDIGFYSNGLVVVVTLRQLIEGIVDSLGRKTKVFVPCTWCLCGEVKYLTRGGGLEGEGGMIDKTCC